MKSPAGLNDIRALVVRPEHVLEAVAAARPGPVAEGSVGAGTRMICYGWKGGIGTASRMTGSGAGSHVVGVLVLANFGQPGDLRIDGRGWSRGRSSPGRPARGAIRQVGPERLTTTSMGSSEPDGNRSVVDCSEHNDGPRGRAGPGGFQNQRVHISGTRRLRLQQRTPAIG